MSELLSKINKNIFLKIGLIIFIILFILFLITCITIKYFISYSMIENQIFKLTGLRLEFIEPRSYFDYKFNLNTKAKVINIYDSKKEINFISIQNPNISLKPLGFLFKRAYFKKINADRIIIKTTRNSNGKIDILALFDENLLKKIKENNIKITRLNSQIENIIFDFDDNYEIKSNIKFLFKNTNINISKKDKIFAVNQIGTIETNISNDKQIADFSIDINSKYQKNFILNNLNTDISLKNINLFIFNDLAKKYISKDISTVNGTLGLNITTQDKENNIQKLNLSIKNPTLKLKDNKVISSFKDSIETEILFIPNKDKIEITEATTKAKDLAINIKGQILKPLSKKPDTDFNINISNTQLNNLIYFIPDNAIFYRPKGIPTLKKSNFFANLNGNLNIKTFPLNITGELKAQNIYIPNYPKTYRQNDITTRFMGDKVRVYTRVYTPDNEYVTVNGISNLDNSLWGNYSIKSTPKIDLKFAQLYLVPIQQIIGFNIGPVPIMDISGYGNINIDTKGTLSDAQIYGEFSAYNAKAEIEGLDAKLENAKCKLFFDDRKLILKEIKGKLDGADFILTGTGNTKGEVELNIDIKNADANNILKTFQNSVISKPYLSLFKDIKNVQGNLDLIIQLNGLIKDYENKALFETLTPKIFAVFNNNKIVFKNGFYIDKLQGSLNSFTNKIFAKGSFNILNSKFTFVFGSKDSLASISKNKKININSEITSNKIASGDILSMLQKTDVVNEKIKNIISQINDINFYSKLSLKSSGEILIDDIDFKKLKHNGYLVGLNDSKNTNFKFNSGIIKILNDKIIFDNLNAKIKESSIKIKGSIFNISQDRPYNDITININNFIFDNINKIFPKIKASKGIIKDGTIFLKGNDVKLNSLSLNWDSTPIFLNAKIKNIYELPYIDSDFSTIIDEISSDNIINPHLISPIKIIGEIPIKGSFKGNQNDYSFDFSATIPKNSDISFSGANIGDINYKREFSGKISITDNIATLNNFKLVKFIANQNNKINPITLFKINGQVVQKNNDISYNDLKIATYSPVNVRILNLLFKKSILKKGNFDCNISLNGNMKLPDITGKISLYDLDIPLYSTQINNIKINISKKFIDGEILAKNNQSDMKLNFHALNKLEPPYTIKDVILSSNKIEVLNLIDTLTPANQKTDIKLKSDIVIKPNDIIIEKGSFNIKELLYNKITTNNLKGNINYRNGLINLSNVVLDIAQGKINAYGKYDLNSTKLKLNAKMEDCDSNILSRDFLGMQNQIYGKMNGNLVLNTKALNTPKMIENINSKIDFSINNGKMPKLGSMEYLLRAGNLFKNGILGLSLNNIIEVLKPYKTGEFEKITGNLSISKGEIDKLNILSQGKNLSLFLEGDYSILENFADIKIYGKLSQNISNALGALGNASISQFVDMIAQVKRNKNNNALELQDKLDKIPPIETEESKPRYFKVKVLGDINKDNYIKSFNWL